MSVERAREVCSQETRLAPFVEASLRLIFLTAVVFEVSDCLAMWRFSK